MNTQSTGFFNFSPFRRINEQKNQRLIYNTQPDTFIKRKSEVDILALKFLDMFDCDINQDEFLKKFKRSIQGKYEKELISILKSEENLEDIEDLIKNKNLSQDEFLKCVKELSTSTLKAVLNNPSQYINFTQDPALKEFKVRAFYNQTGNTDKDYMIDFFNKNAGRMIYVLNCTDADTLNQILDKRTTTSRMILKSVFDLTEENGKNLKYLTSFVQKGNAKEKIKLCHLIDIIQTRGLNSDLLNDVVKDGKVDNERINKILKDILTKDINAELYDKNNPDFKFNNEFGYLLFKNKPLMAKGAVHNREYVQGFREIIESVLNDNFDELLNDDKTPWGIANQNTEKLFKNNEFNYHKWLKTDISDKEFKFEGKKYKIRQWKRNPAEDLFIGNKTKCCTAIGTGSNSSAIPTFLLNTSFNYAEILDEKGDDAAMARIYMAEVNEEPAIVIDAIEFSDIKQMSDDMQKIMLDELSAYIKEFAKNVANKDIPVYLVYQDATFKIDDYFESDHFRMQFIGDVSVDKIYSNMWSAQRWDDIRDKTYVVLSKIC